MCTEDVRHARLCVKKLDYEGSEVCKLAVYI